MPALALDQFVGTSDIGDVIPSEHIQSYIEGMNLPINIGDILVSVIQGRGYVDHQFARWAAATLVDPVRAGGETDEFLRMHFNTESSTIQPTLRGFVLVYSEEAMASQQEGAVPLGMVEQAMRLVMQYRDRGIIEAPAAATNTAGDSATQPTFAQWRATKHLFEALENPGEYVFIGHPHFFQTLGDEFIASNSPLMARLGSGGMLNGGKSAYRGEMLDIDMWQSSHIALDGGGGASSFFTTVKGNRVLGHIAQENIRITHSKGDEMQRRASDQLVIKWSDGTGILRNDGLHEYVHAAA